MLFIGSWLEKQTLEEENVSLKQSLSIDPVLYAELYMDIWRTGQWTELRNGLSLSLIIGELHTVTVILYIVTWLEIQTHSVNLFGTVTKCVFGKLRFYPHCNTSMCFFQCLYICDRP